MTVHASPQAAADLLRKAKGELQHRRFGAAEATLGSALALAPDWVPALQLAGLAAQMQGKHEQAAGYFRRAITSQPRDGGLYAGLVISLFESACADGVGVLVRGVVDL